MTAILGSDTAADPLTSFRLDGKTALITGAASGLGRETARLFRQVGARVIYADLNGAAAIEWAEEVVGSGAAMGVELDVADEAAVRVAFAQAADRFGGVDILVNNAAYRPKADTMTMPVEEWDRMHAVNTRGAFLCMREAIRQMRQRGGGSVVNISSMSAVHPTIFPNMHYDSSKAGMGAMTRLAAIEFAQDRIRVNAVLPGGMDTKGGSDIRAGQVKIAGPAVIPGRNPMGRMAQPVEIARTVLFLASDAASYITGVELLVDGGFCLG